MKLKGTVKLKGALHLLARGSETGEFTEVFTEQFSYGGTDVGCPVV